MIESTRITVGRAFGSLTLRDRVEISQGTRATSAVGHDLELEEFRTARAEVAALGRVHLDEARHHVALIANRHRRSLGLPTDRDLDGEDFRAGIRRMRSQIQSMFDRLAAQMRPLVAFANSIEQNRPRVEYALAPPTKETP